MHLEWSGLVFAFTAGVFTLFSPCSFPLLPGYISYYIGTETILKKAIPSGIVCSLGLILVFSLVGLVVMAAHILIQPYLNIIQIIAAIIIIIFGIIMLTKVTIPRITIPIQPSKRKGSLGLFIYGVAYGMAALACSSPIFFSVMFYATLAGGAMQGLVTFIVYALGMSIPLIIITYLIATMKQLLINRIRNALPTIQKFSGVLLILIGILLIADYYDYIHLL